MPGKESDAPGRTTPRALLCLALTVLLSDSCLPVCRLLLTSLGVGSACLLAPRLASAFSFLLSSSRGSLSPRKYLPSQLTGEEAKSAEGQEGGVAAASLPAPAPRTPSRAAPPASYNPNAALSPTGASAGTPVSGQQRNVLLDKIHSLESTQMTLISQLMAAKVRGAATSAARIHGARRNSRAGAATPEAQSGCR